MKRYINFLILLTGVTFSQNPQFLSNGVFYFNGYFFNADSLTTLKTLSGDAVNFGQNDSIAFIGNGNNVFSWNKYTLEQNPVFDTALFYSISVTDYGFMWNVVYLNGKKFSPDPARYIITVQDSSGNFLFEINDKESAYKRNINGRDILLKGNNCAVYVKDLEGEIGYIISGYDEKGNEIYRAKTEHTNIEVTGNTNYHKRYLNYFKHNSKYAVFTTNVFYKDFSRTVILELATGVLTEVPVGIDGVLFDRQDNIAGFFQYNEKENEVIFYDKMSDDVLWKYKYSPKNVYASNITALIYDDILVLALYHQISTGSDLIALDMKTGSLKWHANVDQVNASHSKYYNTVNLYTYKDKILMEGIESYGKYLQVFDVNSGAKLYSDMNRK